VRFGKGIRILATSFVMALPLAQAADCGAPVIEVVDAAALKGIKRVAVTSFTVQYVTSQVWDTSPRAARATASRGRAARSSAPASGRPPAKAEKGNGAGAITSVFYSPGRACRWCWATSSTA
jgi:hypothetical protein